MEHCLSGGFIGDGSANVVLFKEVTKTGEVARARERGKGLGRLAAEECFRSSGNAHGLTGISVQVPKSLMKEAWSSRKLKEP